MQRRLLFVFLLIGLAAFAEEPTELDFASAYSAILQRSLRIANEQWNVQAADARVTVKRAAFLPTFTGSLSQTNDNVAYTPLQVSNEASLTAGINVYRYGADTAALDGAKDDFRKENENLANEYLGAEQEAVEAIVLAIQRKRQKDSVAKIAQIKSEAYEVAKQRYKRGLLPILEVEKSGIDLENSRTRLKNSDVALSSANSALTVLLGHARIHDDWPWQKMLKNLANSDQLHFNLDGRPDYRSAQQAVFAESSRLSQYHRQMYPSLDFSFSFNDINFNQSDVRDYETGLTLTFNFFNQLQDYNAYQLQKVTLGQAEVHLETVKRQAEAQVEMLRRQFQQQLDAVRSLDRTLEITRRITEDSMERFRMGRATVNDLSIDQSRLLETEILDTDSWAATHTAYASLCHACGLRLMANGTCGDIMGPKITD